MEENKNSIIEFRCTLDSQINRQSTLSRFSIILQESSEQINEKKEFESKNSTLYVPNFKHSALCVGVLNVHLFFGVWEMK